MARTFFAIFLGVALVSGAIYPALADVPALNQPSWAQLSPEQQTILSPLAGEWAGLESFQRKKWLGITQRYSAMSADEQARVQQRMRDWAKLTPAERKSARENYKSLKQGAPEQKEVIKQKWEEYSQLPDSDKNQLKADAARKPSIKAVAPTVPPRPLQQPGQRPSPLLIPAIPKNSPPKENSNLAPDGTH